MPPIRVLVVDDSVVIRKILCDVLSSDPAVQVAGIASDGHIALARIAQLKPDLVTLDVEMPNLSGLETIVEIRKLYPKLPVIMFSTLTERGASTTLDALSLGASDYVTKPSNTGSLDVTMAKIKQDLLPKIKALCGRSLFAKTQLVPSVKEDANPRKGSVLSKARIDVLAIGTSTGGPNALAELLPAIPADFPVPIVIVQHMPPLFTRMLAERLNRGSAIAVEEGEPGKMLKAGKAWIAPGNYHMTVVRRGGDVQLAMNQDAPENSCRPAVDVLFRSVAATFGANTLGDPVVVITVNVAANAAANVTNTASVSGGGEVNVANDTSTDVTSISLPPDFTFSFTVSTITVTAGQPASYTLTITPQNNVFANAITFTASGLPARTSVVFTPASVTPGANPVTTTMVVSTTAGDPFLGKNSGQNRAPLYALLMPFAGFLLSAFGFRKRGWKKGWFLTVMLVCIGLGVYGCTGSQFNLQNLGTPAGSYTVTVTGTSGTLQHSAPVTLNVQP